jgi:hypothetical protein
VALVTSSFPQTRPEPTGGGGVTLVVPIGNGRSLLWQHDGGWRWGVQQDDGGGWLETGAGTVPPAAVLNLTRALAQEYGRAP